MVVVTQAGCFVLKAVLHLKLGVRGEAVSNRSVDPPQILAPAQTTLSSVVDGSKNLLVPAQRAEKLRCKFIFSFKIIGERVCVTDPRNFKTRFVNFRPHLQVMPGEAGILTENEFVVITNVAARRQGLFRLRSQIDAIRDGRAKVPSLIRAKAEASSEARMFEPNRGHIPRLGPRGERSIFHFASVIKHTEPSGNRNAAGVTGSPDYGIEFILRIRLKASDEILR